MGRLWSRLALQDRDWLASWDWFLRRLNEQRDNLTRVVPGGLMLAGPDGAERPNAL
ncbi:MAG: hypothetical protein M3066_04925 [Actinomycetota bacterium]|nr:hypothetical protein [Actinomycetota bacterium]